MLKQFRYPGQTSDLVIALGLFGLAVLVRLGFSFVIYPRLAGPLGLGFDPDHFGMLARNLVEGKGYRYDFGTGELTTYRGPAFPLVLAAAYALTGNIFPSAVVVQAIIGALAVPVVFKTGKHVYGSTVGLLAALVTTFHPLLIWYSPRIRYEPLLALLTTLTVYYAVRLLDSERKTDAVLVGIFAGLATLVSQVFMFLPPLLALATVFCSSRKALMTKRVISAIVVACVVIAPWTIRNYRVTGGRFVPVQTGGVMEFVRGIHFVQIYPQSPMRVVQVDHMVDDHLTELLGVKFFRGDRSTEEALLPYAVSHLRNQPEKLMVSILVQIPRFWYLSESPMKSWFLIALQSPFLCLGLVGFVQTLREKRYGGLLVFLAAAYFNLIYSVFHAKARFSTPVVPCLIILAVAGLATARQHLRRRGLAFTQSSHKRGDCSSPAAKHR